MKFINEEIKATNVINESFESYILYTKPTSIQVLYSLCVEFYHSSHDAAIIKLIWYLILYVVFNSVTSTYNNLDDVYLL